MKPLLLASALALAGLGTALAQSDWKPPHEGPALPIYDLRSYCAARYGFMASEVERDRQISGCLYLESIDYDLTVLKWPKTSVVVRAECVRRQDPAVDPAHRLPNYHALNVCMEAGAP
jgi:hypothetical protein